MRFLVFLFLLTIPNFLLAQKISFSGYGAAGYRYTHQVRIIEYNQETYYEGKFQADLKVNKHIEAQLDFRGNSNDQKVELREFSAKFSYLKRLKFEIGHIKKPFGSEYMEKEEELAHVGRSFLTESAGDIGYVGRSVGLMAYYKTKRKKEFPHSYYLYVFKDRNLQNGVVARYIHHLNDFEIGGNYFLLSAGGDYPVTTNGYAASLRYSKKSFFIETEAMLLQDPVEQKRRQMMNEEDDVYAWGARISSAAAFKTGLPVVKEIEPLLLFSYYQPDTKINTQHTFQLLGGLNFYFDKDVRLRFNADIILTRNEYNKIYSNLGSRFTLEMQVRF